MVNLDKTVIRRRDVWGLHPPGHPDRSRSLNNLSCALWSRFQQTGKTADLDESIACDRDALQLRPEGHADRSESLNGVALSLLTRFEQSGRTEDLEESISLYRAALELLPTGHTDRSMSSTNLATALQTRFRQSGRTEDLEEAILLSCTASDLCPAGHPLRSSSAMSLANALVTRFEQSGRTEDLEEAVSLYRAALELLPTGHPDRSVLLTNLAMALMSRFEQVYHKKDLEEAMELLESGARHEFSSALTCLRLASWWADVARSYNHSTTISAYSATLIFLERSLNIVPTVNMQHELLNGKSGYPTLAVDAASYAIKKGNLAQAVEFLEQGRALLRSRIRGFRRTIDHLAEVDKELAYNFEDVSNKLEALATVTSPKTRIFGSSIADSLTGRLQSRRVSLDDMIALSEDRKNVINKIREVPRFENFEGATPFVTLQRAADEGPIVIVNHF